MTEMVSVPAPRGMHKPLEMIGTRLLKFYRDRLALVEPIHHTDNERQVLVAALELLQAALQVPSETTLKPLNLAARIKLTERIAKSVNGMNAKQIIMYALEIRDSLQ